MSSALEFSAGLGSRTLDSSGKNIVDINGILTIGASQPPEDYSGSYLMTLNY
ncbi:MAG: hypothetical protein ACJAZX_001625 [Rickettsiales bacterium]|jgi:hypothetical protein